LTRANDKNNQAKPLKSCSVFFLPRPKEEEEEEEEEGGREEVKKKIIK